VSLPQVKSERMKKNTQTQNNQLNNQLDKPITLEEVKKAIKELKRGKAVGVDNYMNEIFMYGGERVEEATWKLCSEIFESEKYPITWARGLIFPIFKGGPEEYRYNPSEIQRYNLIKCTW
jgi:hypothetical protein